MAGYADNEPDVVAADKAVRRLRAAGQRSRADWVIIGKGLARVQSKAMAIARSNHPTGKAYNAAHAEIMEDYPNLQTLAKDTRSHALWLHNHREEVHTWLKQRSLSEMELLTHPKTIHQRFDQHHRPPPRPPHPDTLAAALRGQERDMLNHEQREHLREPEDMAEFLRENYDSDQIERLIAALAAKAKKP
jgi:hypothetical protein